ncbi:hypothetical protein LF887_08365 [Chryseobacterium sp. MEBOG06]|nr:hypothetical protein [Chryseobacterium sp. MEBOG06]UKB85621.1 hypothetical protein LF887_08365 [Chryseobacterium sp. MEBOG06]
MKIHKRIRPLFTIIFLFILSGCAVGTDFYIQNLTDVKKMITINYKSRVFNDLKRPFHRDLSFNYEDEIVSPKVFKKIKNLKTLEKIEVRDSSVIMELHPHSTTRIDQTFNANWYMTINSVDIDGKEYSIKELEKNAEKIHNDYIYKIKSY